MLTRRNLILVLLALVMVTPVLASASSQDYSYTIPATGDIYTSSRSLTGGYDYGVVHRYSGGKDIGMQMVRASDYIALGSTKTIKPGGSGATLRALWTNTGPTRSVRVRLNSALGVVVTVLAEGTWYWNY